MDLARAKRIGKKLLPYITVLFLGLVAILLYDSLSQVDWEEVKEAMTGLAPSTLLTVIALTFFNYFLYALFDYISFHYLKIKDMKSRRLFPSAAICYAFNLNLGALVGGMGLRYKIYSGWKVSPSKLPYIPLVSAVTSWSGYVLLLGILFAVKSEEVAKWMPLSDKGVFGIGLMILGIIMAYALMCLFKVRPSVKNKELHLPGLGGALIQFSVSALQWCIPSVIIWTLMRSLGGDVGYEQVLFTHLIAGVAGVVTHIPGGLGVLETIFLRAPFSMPASQVLVALLGFRAVYYFLPLALALPGYLYLEYYQNRHVKKSFLKRARG